MQLGLIHHQFLQGRPSDLDGPTHLLLQFFVDIHLGIYLDLFFTSIYSPSNAYY